MKRNISNSAWLQGNEKAEGMMRKDATEVSRRTLKDLYPYP